MDRFVVGTGRCGSTLLTRMLSCHRDLLGLNEVFTGLDWGRRFAPEPISGAEVADILDAPNRVIQMVTARGHDAEEVTYPFDSSSRYGRGDPIPWILTSTLGHLDDDPDALWDDLSAWLARRGSDHVASHYRALFEHLAERAGKSAWVERSGSSIDYLGELLECFAAAAGPLGEPTAVRVVHIWRDGAEVALSMRNHAFYRLAVQLYYGLMPEGVDPSDEDAVVDAWLDGDPPVELYGRYWSEQLEHGETALRSLGEEQLLTVDFSAVTEDPGPEIERIGRFLGMADDPGFADRAAALVRGVPPSRAPALGPTERAGLDDACAAGQAVLQRLDARTR